MSSFQAWRDYPVYVNAESSNEGEIDDVQGNGAIPCIQIAENAQ